MKRLLKGGRVVDPANGIDGIHDVLIDGDRIARVGRDLPVDGASVVEVPPVPTPPAVPEAGHIWVDDEPELELSAPVNLFAAEPAAVHADPAPAAPFMDRAPEPHPNLSGVAARLRALPGPISPEALPDLRELHSRLGLVQAQMAEALRQRR